MIRGIFIVYHWTSVIESAMGNHYHRNAKQVQWAEIIHLDSHTAAAYASYYSAI